MAEGPSSLLSPRLFTRNQTEPTFPWHPCPSGDKPLACVGVSAGSLSECSSFTLGASSGLQKGRKHFGIHSHIIHYGFVATELSPMKALCLISRAPEVALLLPQSSPGHLLTSYSRQQREIPSGGKIRGWEFYPEGAQPARGWTK